MTTSGELLEVNERVVSLVAGQLQRDVKRAVEISEMIDLSGWSPQAMLWLSALAAGLLELVPGDPLAALESFRVTMESGLNIA